VSSAFRRELLHHQPPLIGQMAALMHVLLQKATFDKTSVRTIIPDPCSAARSPCL